ncbi:MAG: hypothetical protein AAB370_06380 [Verrucomicrobiota bacterium]
MHAGGKPPPPPMKHIRLVLAVTTIALASINVEATLLRSTQMVGYNTGNLGTTGVGAGADAWENSTAQVTVTNGSGSLDGTSLGLVASAGDRAFISATTALNVRNQFVPASTYPVASTDTNIYFSFLYRFRNVADVSSAGELMIRMNTGTSGTGTAQHWDLHAREVGGQIQLGIAKAAGITNFATTNISQGETVFVVIRQHMIVGGQNDVYDLWINPPAQFFGTNELDVPPVSATVGALVTDGTEAATGSGPGRFVVVAGLNSEFDEFRAATTWAEVTPAFGSCVGAAIETHPTNVTQVAEISASFYAKALASATSPTYQWQRSTNNGGTWNNISGAASSSYTTPNLTLAESGSQYRVIVNVTCGGGSSATSSVATVTLTSPAVTPVGIVMDDTFLDPELGFDDRANLPLTITNSTWYTLVTDDLTAFGQGGNMLGTPAAGSSRLWLGYFTATNALPVHLSVGRAIKVTLPFTPNSFSSFTNNGGLRFGLFDYFDGGNRIVSDGAAAGGSAGNGNGVRGYMLNLDFGPTFTANSPLQLLTRSSLGDNNLMGSVALYESLGSGPAGGGYTGAVAFQAGTQYTLEFTVSRIDINSVNVTAAISGGGTNWSHSVTETNAGYHRFDSFGIRLNSLETSADSFSIAEFKVEVLQGAVSVPSFNITSIESLSQTALKLTWNSVSGASYHVLSRSTLSGVETTNATIVATGSSTSYTNNAVSGSERYYRVLAPPYTP